MDLCIFGPLLWICHESPTLHSEQQSFIHQFDHHDLCSARSPRSSFFFPSFSFKQAASLLLRLSLGWLIVTDYSWRHRGHNLWRTNIKAFSSHTSRHNTLLSQTSIQTVLILLLTGVLRTEQPVRWRFDQVCLASNWLLTVMNWKDVMNRTVLLLTTFTIWRSLDISKIYSTLI